MRKRFFYSVITASAFFSGFIGGNALMAGDIISALDETKESLISLSALLVAKYPTYKAPQAYVNINLFLKDMKNSIENADNMTNVVSDKDREISDLKSQVTSLNTQVTDLQGQISTNQDQFITTLADSSRNPDIYNSNIDTTLSNLGRSIGGTKLFSGHFSEVDGGLSFIFCGIQYAFQENVAPLVYFKGNAGANPSKLSLLIGASSNDPNAVTLNLSNFEEVPVNGIIKFSSETQGALILKNTTENPIRTLQDLALVFDSSWVASSVPTDFETLIGAPQIKLMGLGDSNSVCDLLQTVLSGLQSSFMLDHTGVNNVSALIGNMLSRV